MLPPSQTPAAVDPLQLLALCNPVCYCQPYLGSIQREREGRRPGILTAAVHQWFNPAGSYQATACLWYCDSGGWQQAYFDSVRGQIICLNEYSSSPKYNRIGQYLQIFKYPDIRSQPYSPTMFPLSCGREMSAHEKTWSTHKCSLQKCFLHIFYKGLRHSKFR